MLIIAPFHIYTTMFLVTASYHALLVNSWKMENVYPHVLLEFMMRNPEFVSMMSRIVNLLKKKTTQLYVWIAAQSLAMAISASILAQASSKTILVFLNAPHQ